ncbi:FtsX-like permease family protein [Microbacterium sp. M1A1_1b]
MIRLTLAGMLAQRRIWIGTLIVAVATGLALSLAATVIHTGIHIGSLDAVALVRESGLHGVPADAIDQVADAIQYFFVFFGSVIVLFSGVCAMVVVATTTNLAVDLQRREYALWQLAGVSPTRIAAIVRGQVALVSLVGAAVGALVGFAVAPRVFTAGFDAASGLPPVAPLYDPLDAVLTTLVVVVIAVLGALRASGRAGRVQAIEALRGPGRAAGRMTIIRWILAALLLLATVSNSLSIGDLQLDQAAVPSAMFPLTAAVTLVALAPLVTPPLLRLWTSIVPARLSSSWFLARNTAEYDLTRSTSTVTVMMIAIALPGGLAAANAVFTSTGATPDTPDASQSIIIGDQTLLLLVGGALVIALAGVAANVYMASSVRDREHALVRSAGSTPGGVLLSAVFEGVILAGTALVQAAVVLLVTGFGLAASLAAHNPSVRPDFGVPPAAGVFGAALVLVILATVVPTLLALRQRLVPMLAAA